MGHGHGYDHYCGCGCEPGIEPSHFCCRNYNITAYSSNGCALVMEDGFKNAAILFCGQHDTIPAGFQLTLPASTNHVACKDGIFQIIPEMKSPGTMVLYNMETLYKVYEAPFYSYNHPIPSFNVNGELLIVDKKILRKSDGVLLWGEKSDGYDQKNGVLFVFVDEVVHFVRIETAETFFSDSILFGWFWWMGEIHRNYFAYITTNYTLKIVNYTTDFVLFTDNAVDSFELYGNIVWYKKGTTLYFVCIPDGSAIQSFTNTNSSYGVLVTKFRDILIIRDVRGYSGPHIYIYSGENCLLIHQGNYYYTPSLSFNGFYGWSSWTEQKFYRFNHVSHKVMEDIRHRFFDNDGIEMGNWDLFDGTLCEVLYLRKKSTWHSGHVGGGLIGYYNDYTTSVYRTEDDSLVLEIYTPERRGNGNAYIPEFNPQCIKGNLGRFLDVGTTDWYILNCKTGDILYHGPIISTGICGEMAEVVISATDAKYFNTDTCKELYSGSILTNKYCACDRNVWWSNPTSTTLVAIENNDLLYNGAFHSWIFPYYPPGFITPSGYTPCCGNTIVFRDTATSFKVISFDGSVAFSGSGYNNEVPRCCNDFVSWQSSQNSWTVLDLTTGEIKPARVSNAGAVPQCCGDVLWIRNGDMLSLTHLGMTGWIDSIPIQAESGAGPICCENKIVWKVEKWSDGNGARLGVFDSTFGLRYFDRETMQLIPPQLVAMNDDVIDVDPIFPLLEA